MTSSSTAPARSAYDVAKIRADFPILRERVSSRLVANLPGAGEAREAVL